MIVNWNDERVTAVAFAKYKVWDKGEGAFYWLEQMDREHADLLTEKEETDIHRAIERQHERVRKFLGQ